MSLADPEASPMTVGSDEEGTADQTASSRGNPNRNALFAGFGLLAMAACLIAAGQSGPRTEIEMTDSASNLLPATPTVRELLESPAMKDIMAQNLVAVGSGDKDQHAEDRFEQIRGDVDQDVRQLSERVRSSNPDSAEQMDSLRLTIAQRDSVMAVMRGLSDSHVQAVARSLASSVNVTMQQGGDRKALKRNLLQTMKSNFGSMRQLRYELFPDAKGGPADQILASKDEDLLRQMDNTDIVKMFDEWSVTAATVEPIKSRRLLFGSSDSSSKATQGGVMTMMKVYYALMKDKFKSTFNMPSTSSASGSGSGAAGLMTCVLKLFPNPSSAFMCPMEEAKTAMQFMKSMFTGSPSASDSSASSASSGLSNWK